MFFSFEKNAQEQLQFYAKENRDVAINVDSMGVYVMPLGNSALVSGVIKLLQPSLFCQNNSHGQDARNVHSTATVETCKTQSDIKPGEDIFIIPQQISFAFSTY